MMETTDEDCLYLNIRTPDINPEAKLPVYVFVHGGGFESGGGNMPLYEGDTFAERGIVFVSINYRLGVFNALSLKSIEDESGIFGNNCVLDSAQAVKWVHENISAFGGDPDNITVGGQSAGAYIVSILMCMESMKGKFRRCILESGSIMSTKRTTPRGLKFSDISRNYSVKFADRFSASDTSEGLAKLRTIPAEELVEKWTFDDDGKQMFPYNAPELANLLVRGDEEPDPRIQPPNDVDLLFGFNTDEASLYVDRNMNVPYEHFLRFMYPRDWQSVMERFPEGFAGTLYDAMCFMISMKSFRASMVPYADVLAKRGCRVYGYHFDYVTDLLRKQKLGCRHIAELYMVFDNLRENIGADNENGAITSEYMNKAWIGFIKNGDPDSETGDTAFDVSWKPYDTEGRNTLKIRTDGITNVRLENEEDIDFLADVR